MSVLIASLLLASASATSGDHAALDAATRAVYAPYQGDELSEQAAWDRDIWTREIRTLVTQWQSVVPPDEPDAMNGADWLCQCQDWDSSNFRVNVRSLNEVQPDAANVAVTIELGFGATRDAVLTFRRESGRWLLDDLRTEDYPDGIKAGLRETIREDEALRKARK